MRASVGPVRTKIGAVSIAVASILSIGTSVAALPEDSATTPIDDTTTTVGGDTSTTEPEPTTTLKELFGSPAPISDIDQAQRPGTTIRTRPLPTTTTTTTTTVAPTTTIPEWVLPANSGTGRRSVYSKSRQRVWAVESDGTVLKTHRVSGKLKWCDPKVGTYSIFSRSRYTNSIQNPQVKWGYMIRFTKGCEGGNIGFHEIPKKFGVPVQSIWQLGQPLSAGCVRQSTKDAIWMWNWAWVGTKVVVLP
jgi:lipoprotein-anchoring transpeptidase ErfK/SrfK